MIGRRYFLTTAGAMLVSGAAMAQAQPVPVISAPEAFSRAQAGDITFIDIRTEGEWRQYGAPQDAALLSLHDPAFLDKFNTLIGHDKTAPVALICAVGGRTAMAAQALMGMGYSGVMDVSEGIFGSVAGPGWLKRGLPVASFE